MRLPESVQLIEIWRYYQAGIVNTVFGLACYAALVRIGMDIYAAQLISHLMGMTFNYVTYSRHVFRDAAPAKVRFVVSYAVNYIVSLGTLAAVSQVISSPYLAGIVTTAVVSVLNYIALKFMVFRERSA